MAFCPPLRTVGRRDDDDDGDGDDDDGDDDVKTVREFLPPRWRAEIPSEDDGDDDDDDGQRRRRRRPRKEYKAFGDTSKPVEHTMDLVEKDANYMLDKVPLLLLHLF